jgi:HEPN domain-containing protein
VSLNRTELRRLADVRLAEANALLATGPWDGAYYLAGYAVECALKARIMAYVERTGAIFEDRKFSAKCWTHDFNALAELAKLELERDKEAATDPQFKLNWETAKGRTETSRYRRTGEGAARALLSAIGDTTHGVLSRIKRHY